MTSVDVSTVSKHSWCCSVDSATDGAALSPNRHGVGVGCTWSTPCWCVLGFVKPVNVGPYFMAGGAAGVTWGGALGVGRSEYVHARACVVPVLLPRCNEVCPRLIRVAKTAIPGRVSSDITLEAAGRASMTPSRHS